MDDEEFEGSGESADADAHDDPPPWDLDHEPASGTFMPGAPPPAEGVAWAELPLRAGALLIDLALAVVALDLVSRAAAWVFQELVFPMDGSPLAGTEQVLRATLILLPTAIAWAMLIGGATYLWRVFRATPGQMALGLFTLRTDGRRLSTGAAATRFVLLALGWLLSSAAGTISLFVVALDPDASHEWYRLLEVVLLAAPVAWYGLLTVTIMRDSRGQGWHDRIAGSVVVRRAGPPS